MKTKLTDIADIIRSKNSGPYELTLDILFKDFPTFEKVCAANILSPETVCRLYHIEPEDIINIVAFKPAKAIKITIKRPICSGDLGETDVYGAQQHAPLLYLEFEL